MRQLCLRKRGENSAPRRLRERREQGLKGKVYYGWIVVACGATIMALTTGMIANTYGLFIIPVAESLGVSRAQMSLSQTLMSMGSLVISLTSGLLYKRYKIHSLMKIACIVVPACYFIYSRSNSLFLTCAMAMLVSMFTALLSFIPFSLILSNWFHKRTGLAVGIAFTGSGVGGMIFYAAAGAMLTAWGWRTTIAFVSILSGSIIIPLVYFVVKISPFEKGLTPYGEEAGEKRVTAEYGEGFQKPIRRWQFALVLVGLMGLGFYCSVMNGTLTPYLQDVGYSVVASAMLSSGYMGALTVGKMFMGGLTDRVGVFGSLAVIASFMMIGTVTMLLSGSLPIALLNVIVMGIHETTTTVMVPLVVRETFGTKDLSSINGLAFAAIYVGSSSAPMAMGLIYDAAGSYRPGYTAMFAVGAVCAPLLMLAVRKAPAKALKDRA